MISLFLAAALAFSSATIGEISSTQRSPVLWVGLRPGPYHVGYRRLDTAGGVVHAWYPTPDSGKPLFFREYLGDDSRRLSSFFAGAGVDSSTVDSLFESPLYAGASPPPLDQTFPLILIAQGNGQDVADQVVLCEYLASQGFVVAATPSPTLRTPMEREDQVGEFAETQASDLASAIGAVSTVLHVDTQRIGIVGHSFGARSALLLAMRDKRIRAIVSLDGGIGTATAVESFRQAPSFHSDVQLPPLLHFYEVLDPFMSPDFGLLKSLHTAELVLEQTDSMHHVHFTTYGFAAAVFPRLAVVTHATSATTRSVIGVCEKTAAFLRRCLR